MSVIFEMIDARVTAAQHWNWEGRRQPKFQFEHLLELKLFMILSICFEMEQPPIGMAIGKEFITFLNKI